MPPSQKPAFLGISQADLPLWVAWGLFLGSALAVGTALGFEHIGGYRPCPLCLLQRKAYYFTLVAAPLAIWAFFRNKRGVGLVLLALIGVGFVINAGLGAYHSGVEWHWWPGPDTCAGGAGVNLSGGNLLESLKETRVVRCDQAPWRFLGLSFAGYNFLISLGFAALAFLGVSLSLRAGRAA